MKRRIFIPAAILIALAAGAIVIPSRHAPVPAVATEAQLVDFVEAQRRAILATPKFGAGYGVGPVIELPARAKVRFLAPPRAVAWFSRGGRFGPDGTLTLPNAEVPFLFPAQEDGGGRARFALLTPAMKRIAPVPNTVDLPTVLLTRGEDRTVWTGRLPKVGDRYTLPESVGERGLAIAAEGFPAPQVGLPAPATMGRGELPTNGILLGRSLLFRLREEDGVLRGGLHPLNSMLLRAGIRPVLPLAGELITGHEVHYEVRTTAHVYEWGRGAWRYSRTRTFIDTTMTTEGSDAVALGKMGRSPIPKPSGSQEEPFDGFSRPGESFLPYRRN